MGKIFLLRPDLQRSENNQQNQVLLHKQEPRGHTENIHIAGVVINGAVVKGGSHSSGREDGEKFTQEDHGEEKDQKKLG